MLMIRCSLLKTVFTIASGQNATNGYVSYTWTVPLNLVNTTDGYSVWVWAYTKAQDATTRVLVRVGSMVQVQALNLASAYPNQSILHSLHLVRMAC